MKFTVREVESALEARDANEAVRLMCQAPRNKHAEGGEIAPGARAWTQRLAYALADELVDDRENERRRMYFEQAIHDVLDPDALVEPVVEVWTPEGVRMVEMKVVHAVCGAAFMDLGDWRWRDAEQAAEADAVGAEL